MLSTSSVNASTNGSLPGRAVGGSRYLLDDGSSYDSLENDVMLLEKALNVEIVD